MSPKQQQKQSHFLAFSACHENSSACAKMKKFQFEDAFTDKKLSINTLMEEIKPIVTLKLEFEYRNF